MRSMNGMAIEHGSAMDDLPKPYYQDDLVTLYHADCAELMWTPQLHYGVVVTDPPYNIGYDYLTYRDRLGENEYITLLKAAIREPAVVIHYPEPMFSVAQMLGTRPTKMVAWVYNANTPRQWRSVAWFGLKPDLSQVRQPYKNPTDRRVRALLEGGADGTALYDWWHIDQVKNVSDEKTEHPCPIPLELARRIVAVTPGDIPIIDPFAGSGTVLRAAKDLGRKAIGIEIDEHYCEIAAKRCAQEVLGLV